MGNRVLGWWCICATHIRPGRWMCIQVGYGLVGIRGERTCEVPLFRITSERTAGRTKGQTGSTIFIGSSKRGGEVGSGRNLRDPIRASGHRKLKKAKKLT